MSEEQETVSATSQPEATSGLAEINPGAIDPRSARPRWWKRPLRFLRGLVLYAAFVALLVWGLPVGLSRWLKTPYPMAAITSGSMWPELKIGDLILVQAVKPDELKIGDIVVYTNPRGFTIHRILRLELSEGNLTTKGDANNVEDASVKVSDVIGRTLNWGNGKPVRIPRLGFISIMVSKRVRK